MPEANTSDSQPTDGANLNGQWVGKYSGTNSGLAVLELDDRGTHFEGQLYAWDEDGAKPSAAMGIRTPLGKPPQFQVSVSPIPIDPRTKNLSSWPELASIYSGVVFPKAGSLKLSCEENSIDVDWGTDIQTNGKAVLARSKAALPSTLKPSQIKSWDEFKRLASSLPHYEYMYRGQESSAWRLRTYFHRTGRADLFRFLVADVPTLHHHLTPFIKHIFKVNDPIDNAAFLALVQHHGYPTPMLDWTYSPYIGAYFAFNDLKPADIKEDRFVRIFIFNKALWETTMDQVWRITPAPLHFSILEPVPINNDRLLPQQALTSVTNVDDIESYIRSRSDGHTYLQVVDLPVTERDRVMNDLNRMGITAGALFPGLDGVCKQLKERFFSVKAHP